MANFLAGIFGSRNQRLLKRYGKIVTRINALEESVQALDDEALKAKTGELKQRVKDGAGLDEARSVCITRDGFIVAAGQTESFGSGPSDVWMLKMDAAGDTLWARAFGGAGSDWADAVCETEDGCYGASGTTGSFNTTRRNSSGAK